MKRSLRRFLFVAVPLVLLALPRQRWLLVLPLVFFAAEYGPMFIPARPAAQGAPLRVMTWNVLFSNEDAGGERAEPLAHVEEQGEGGHSVAPLGLGRTLDDHWEQGRIEE